MANPSEKNSPQRRKPPKLERWEAVTVALLGAVFFAAICSSVLPHARTHDFLGFYTGGLLAKTDPAHLYDAELQSKIQHQLAPEIPVFTPWPRPAFYSLFFIPLSFMSLKTAFAVWIGLGIATAFAIWYWAFRQFGPEALVYCALFVPLGFGIAHGQDIAFVSGLCVLAYSAAKSGRKVLCGVLLALLLGKYHLFLLMPVVLLARREWRILAGYVPSALAAIGVSLAMSSPQSYVALLTNPTLAALNPSPEMMINIHAIANNLSLDLPIVNILLALGIVAAVLLIPHDAPLDRWFWAAVCGGLLISPHTFEYDAALLLIPILTLLTNSTAAPPIRWIAATAVIPLPYFMTLLPKPLSAGPAILISLLFFAIAWPDWFDSRIPSAVGASKEVVV